MREIKFRGRWNGKWVYGGIEIRHNGETLIGGNGVWSVVDSKTVGQFTNLKDQNGKEIYEGDIVKFQAREDEGGGWSSHFKGIGKIGYSNDWGWRMELRDGTQRTADMMMRDVESLEVIGNIYENPEICPTS